MAKSRKSSRYKIVPPSKGSAKRKTSKASRGRVAVKTVDTVEVSKVPGVKIVVGKTAPHPAVRIRVGIPQYSPVQLLDRYAESVEFRKCVDTGRYVFAEGRMVLRSPDCIEVAAGRISIKDSIRSKLDDYCIHTERSRKYRTGVVPRRNPHVRYSIRRSGGALLKSRMPESFQRCPSKTGQG